MCCGAMQTDSWHTRFVLKSLQIWLDFNFYLIRATSSSQAAQIAMPRVSNRRDHRMRNRLYKIELKNQPQMFRNRTMYAISERSCICADFTMISKEYILETLLKIEIHTIYVMVKVWDLQQFWFILGSVSHLQPEWD